MVTQRRAPAGRVSVHWVIAVLIASASIVRASPVLDSHVFTANAVAIHYLDSGGTKPALLFIPGLGDTAYMIESFASRFTRTNRVIAMTRRGFGRSSVPQGGYELSSRVEDIRGLLNRLKIQRAVLIGHSIAGDELTAFATKYPQRVASLIYLDAAYDRSDADAPQPTRAVWDKVLDAWLGSDELAHTSLDRYRAMERRTFFGVWTPSQERNLRETIVVNVDGTVSSRTPQWVSRTISESERSARLSLSSVKAPALLVFARQRLELRGLHLDAATRTGLIRDEEAYESYFYRYISKLKMQRNLTLVVIPQTMHHLYLEEPDRVERLIRAFLTEHPAATSF